MVSTAPCLEMDGLWIGKKMKTDQLLHRLRLLEVTARSEPVVVYVSMTCINSALSNLPICCSPINDHRSPLIAIKCREKLDAYFSSLTRALIMPCGVGPHLLGYVNSGGVGPHLLRYAKVGWTPSLGLCEGGVGPHLLGYVKVGLDPISWVM
ncbi:hypothetical protein RRG08_027482 [Elysia crispata]|uniref:Uncharacterized protein n=1 Tax=Elysia crispata TaxID=231223 RepID=A0AAE1D369_9GAST|nr:hypothetical protein RRG08_027482 [Elysia crispata]